ncbi:class I SAM-dependent methyltransferase [Microlunatus sp. Y2014]|uniref:class I SAM-dependent methyltransferase n=1 Tax=Microlunatus sp. Y2014 TaxID=3418488 RepID=UPI003DA6FA1D
MTDELLAAWRAEEGGQPEGWDFSSLGGRMTGTPLPWDLDAMYRELLGRASRVLDMGTGGGEYLRSFADDLPDDTVATEGWRPNVPVARAALQPYGIEVVEHDPDSEPRMPFPDGRFDLVLNRHEAFDVAELARVLAPGGTFVTQQVGGLEVGELHALTGKQPDNPQVTLERCRSALGDAGLEVVASGQDSGWYEFVDVAALVAYLQLVPWDVPDDFSVDRYRDALLTLHERGPAIGKPVRLTKLRFWIRAVRPA